MKPRKPRTAAQKAAAERNLRKGNPYAYTISKEEKEQQPVVQEPSRKKAPLYKGGKSVSGSAADPPIEPPTPAAASPAETQTKRGVFDDVWDRVFG